MSPEARILAVAALYPGFLSDLHHQSKRIFTCMIPADIDVDGLAAQLTEDGVAIDQLGHHYPSMEGELQQVLAEAGRSDFGSAGIVLLDHAPERSADQRDIAQDLLNLTNLDTVIVRSPGSGAIVSDVHTRAEIESAQWHFLGNSDYVAATRDLVGAINSAGVNWPMVTAVLLVTLVAAVALTAWSVRSRVRP